jgi:hypothetical protein
MEKTGLSRDCSLHKKGQWSSRAERYRRTEQLSKYSESKLEPDFSQGIINIERRSPLDMELDLEVFL